MVLCVYAPLNQRLVGAAHCESQVVFFVHSQPHHVLAVGCVRARLSALRRRPLENINKAEIVTSEHGCAISASENIVDVRLLKHVMGLNAVAVLTIFDSVGGPNFVLGGLGAVRVNLLRFHIIVEYFVVPRAGADLFAVCGPVKSIYERGVFVRSIVKGVLVGGLIDLVNEQVVVMRANREVILARREFGCLDPFLWSLQRLNLFVEVLERSN